MGLSAGTCAISGLPIEEGDRIRIVLLVENPLRGRDMGTFGSWLPRTWPLRARYNGYRGAKSVETGPAQEVWLEALTYDAVPKGWGENNLRDVPISKAMSWDQLMEALRNSRLQVRGYFKNDLQSLDLEKSLRVFEKSAGVPETKALVSQRKKTIPKGIPTRARVEKALTTAGFPLYSALSEGYTISKVRFGEVRVRFESWENKPLDGSELERVRQALSEYATAVVAGTGKGHADLLVLPKPKTDGYPRSSSGKGAVEVALGMIREDVWQSLLGIEYKDENDRKHTIQAYYREVDDYLKGKKPEGRFAAFLCMWDGLPGVLARGSHLYLMRKRKALTRSFLRTVVEFEYIEGILGMTRFHWYPSNAGPQFGEWGLHYKVLHALSEVVRDRPSED